MSDKRIKIEILTDRKIIPVSPPPLRGAPDRIEVDVCRTCGAVVFDFIRHDDWHRKEQ